MLTGEYFVLDGAAALAVPTRYGQSLQVSELNGEPTIKWKSFDEKKECWFSATFESISLKLLKSSDQSIASTLAKLLLESKRLNADFLTPDKGYICETQLTFPRKWGLGTSSTLINNLASWAEINPYELLEATMGGSGYDIACASNNSPIIYKRSGFHPTIEPIDYNPAFKDNLYFVYLENKKDSREGIKKYKSVNREKESYIQKLDALTSSFVNAENLHELNTVIVEHEALISDFIGINSVKSQLFPDFWGEIKSLGAWGGDFVLVTSQRDLLETVAYFSQMGYPEVIQFENLMI